MKTLIMGLLILFTLQGSLIYCDTNLQFAAYRNDKHIYSVNYLISSVSKNIEILTEVKGEGVHEVNKCVLVNGSVKEIIQDSSNEMENLHYQWEVRSNTFNYYNKIDGLSSSGEFILTEDSHSLQSLMFILLSEEITSNVPLFYKLIVPPNQLHGISISIIGNEILNLNGTSYDCWKLEVRLDNIFGIFLPKWHYWATKSKPHIPLKYQSGDTTVYLVNFEIDIDNN